MSKKTGAPEFIGMAIAEIIGWAFCMVILAGAYLIGFYLADHFGGAEHRDAFGILSALVLIWLYEHRLAEERWSRFLQRYDS